MRSNVNNQNGIALPIVIAIVAIVTLLGFTAMSLAENQTLMVTRHQQQEKALHYAEAGVYKYMSLLNENRDFYNTPASTALENIDTAFESGYYNLSIILPTVANPAVIIRSTGWTKSHPDIRRTVEVSVYKREFVQNIYASEKETNENGEQVWWIRGDEVNGPLHTNGTLNVDGTGGDGPTGPVFNGPVTYTVSLNQKNGTQLYNSGPPQKVNPLVFPPNNSSLKTLAQKNGYLYTGRTCIYINGDKVTIRNQDKSAETRPLPANGVIYVDGATGDNKWALNTANVFVSGELDGCLSIASANDIYITAWDPTNWNKPSTSGPGGTYTGGLLYNGYTGNNIEELDSMLGLIAARYVRILHNDWPRDEGRSWSKYDVAPKNISVHAAIFALNRSFEYESWDTGKANDKLTLLGSITQNKRGAVGTYSGQKIVTGYNKSYTHDPRMLYDMPPHFLEPANSGWEIRSWREVNL